MLMTFFLTAIAAITGTLDILYCQNNISKANETAGDIRPCLKSITSQFDYLSDGYVWLILYIYGSVPGNIYLENYIYN